MKKHIEQVILTIKTNNMKKIDRNTILIIIAIIILVIYGMMFKRIGNENKISPAQGKVISFKTKYMGGDIYVSDDTMTIDTIYYLKNK